MKRFAILAASLLATACTAQVTPEDVQAECSSYEWEAEQRDCYREKAIAECTPSLCELLGSETLQKACERAVERACN